MAKRFELRSRRPRVLVVNVFFDDYRRTQGSPYKIPMAMTHIYLAGAFARDRCEVRVFNEQADGALADLAQLAWCDMLVLTGLTSSFDRLLHLTAYTRVLNPGAVVVAGGPAVRALSTLSSRYFDYACVGDIEELGRIAAEVFGGNAAAREVFPRYDLLNGRGRIGYVETSRNCNFRCSFCSLTGERARYASYSLDFIERQIRASGKKTILFIDNNFYGPDRAFFVERMELMRSMHRAGHLDWWSALVTADFFLRPENLELVRSAGGASLFSGVESFDSTTLAAYRKRQNLSLTQFDLIRRCLEAGVMFQYGMMLDVAARPIADLEAEIDLVLDHDEISLPAFLTLPIPLLGTPYFRECLERQSFLPNVRLRDLDGTTINVHTHDSQDRAVEFTRRINSPAEYRRRILKHFVRFIRRYRRTLGRNAFKVAAINTAVIAAPRIATSPGAWRAKPRTHHGPTESLDETFTPAIRIPESYRGHFDPTPLTDGRGELATDVVPDLATPAPTSLADHLDAPEAATS